jgi:hypothetical protein
VTKKPKNEVTKICDEPDICGDFFQMFVAFSEYPNFKVVCRFFFALEKAVAQLCECASIKKTC